MELIGRIFNGTVRALSAPVNVVKTTVNAVIAQTKTVARAGGELLKGNILGAGATLIGGTVKNAVNAGVNLALDGNPVTAFAHGAISNSNGWIGDAGWGT